jgi:hypothetical protein
MTLGQKVEAMLEERKTAFEVIKNSEFGNADDPKPEDRVEGQIKTLEKVLALIDAEPKQPPLITREEALGFRSVMTRTGREVVLLRQLVDAIYGKGEGI